MKTKCFSKRLVSIVVVLAMLLSIAPAFSVLAREYAADLSINGTTVAFESQAYSKNDIIYVPLEELGKYLNIQMTKEGDTYTITRLGQVMKVQLGNMVVSLDGKSVKLPSHPEEKNGVAYVPVELFSAGFGCPVTIAEDKRSADLVPNVYRVSITEERAAAVSAAAPDKDILATGTSGIDTIFNNAGIFPELEKSLFYMIDLSAFNGLKIEKVMLALNIDKAEYSPTLRIERTAPWKKGEVTYSTQPASYDSEYVTGLVAESDYVDKQYNITTLANFASKAGETLAIKLMGIPHSSKINSNKNSFTIRGVNHAKAPYVIVYLAEDYIFPVKTETAQEDGDADRYSKFALLQSLGVFTENDEFPLDLAEGVQRQEFVKYALRLRNTPATSGSGEAFFSDVPVDAPFYNDVMTAHSLGLVAGWQGIAFRPYDRITIGEAITILGRMLNYNIYADERGGFTPGYFAAARQGDLYLGTTDEKGELSFNKMFDLFEDALDAKMLNVRSYRTDGTAEYTFDESMTVLTQFWNAALVEGTVTANEYSSLVKGENGAQGTIVINSKKLTLNFEPYNQFLGYNVKAYYDKYEDVLLYMGIKEYDITDINLADITGKSQSDSVISFTYEKENGNYARESFSRNGKVIYNGKLVADKADITTSLLDADAGSIRLVGANLTVITAYKTVVVSSVNIGDEIIYDAYDPYDRSINLKGKEWTLTNTEGKKVQLESISKNDVISVAQSFDTNLISAIISTKKITSTLSTAENLGSDDAVLTIAGVEYELCNQERVPGSDEYWTDYLKLGLNATFLIDFNGNIAGVDIQKDTGVIGYLLGMDFKGSALSKKLQAAVVIKASSEYVIYDFADKVEVDGKKYKNHEDIATYFTNNDAIEKPIVFDLNAEGQIKKVDTPILGKDDEGNLLEDEGKTLAAGKTVTNANYKSSGIYGGKYFIGLGDGMIIAKGGDEFEDYVVKSGLTNNTNHTMEIWTIGNDNPEAAVALVSGSSTPSVDEDAVLYVVDRVAVAYNSDGYEVKKLYYYSGVDSLKSVLVDFDYESAVDGFKRGDIIRFTTNVRGELHAAKKYYDYETKSLTAKAGNYNAHNRVSAGYVARIESTYVKLVDYDQPDIGNPSEDGEVYTWHNGKRFKNLYSYEVSSAGVTVKKETLDSIRTYEDVPYNPQGLILNAAYENIRDNVWLFDMVQPDNTGVYKVSYSSGTEDAVTGVPETISRYNPGEDATVGDAEPKRYNYTFTGWMIKGSDDKTLYKSGDTIPVNSSIELVAQWVYTPTLKFTFTDPDGDLAPYTEDFPLKDITGTSYAASTLPKADAFDKEGYALIGWQLDGKTYAPGAEFTPGAAYENATVGATFTAVWMKNWSGTAATAAPEFVDGYYQIKNGEDLAWFSNQVKTTAGSKAKLVNDIYLNNFADCGDGKQIDATSENWYDTSANVTAANDWTSFTIDAFAGEFDGNGKTIYGLYMKGGSGTGFFSSVAGGTVKNVTFKGAYLVSTTESKHATYGYYNGVNYKPVAVVAANVTTANTTSNFINITVYGKITATEDGDVLTAGGIIGRVDSVVNITDCTSYADIIHLTLNGGNAFVIDKKGNTSTKTVEVTKAGIGGIIGYMGDGSSTNDGANATLTRCYNYGNIVVPYTNGRIAGVVGHLRNGKLDMTGTCGNAGKIRAYSGGKQMLGYTSSYADEAQGATNTLTGGSVAAYDPNETIN